MQLITRVFQAPEESFFLFGPRGTGKSTLIKSRYAEAIWIDLLRPENFRGYLAQPERLYDLVAGNPQRKTIVIDEVQRVPGLLPVIHDLIERKLGLQFILTGSSARKLKRTSADLLGGRALKKSLHPFIAAELGNQFNLSQALQHGLLPLVVQAQSPQEVLHAYVELYLQEEIQAEGLVRNIENFSRFLQAIAFSNATVLNVANIARECEVKRKTVENYINILEELLLAFQLPVFAKRAQRDLSVHPKFYLFDTGVFHNLLAYGPLDRREEIEGIALESLVAQHLRAWNDYSQEKHTLAFWRTRGGLEVDFIIYGPKGLWAIEVKNAKRVYATDTKGLQAFVKDYPIAQPILLYRGQERLLINKILCLPCEEFLRQLRPDAAIEI